MDTADLKQTSSSQQFDLSQTGTHFFIAALAAYKTYLLFMIPAIVGAGSRLHWQWKTSAYVTIGFFLMWTLVMLHRFRKYHKGSVLEIFHDKVNWHYQNTDHIYHLDDIKKIATPDTRTLRTMGFRYFHIYFNSGPSLYLSAEMRHYDCVISLLTSIVAEDKKYRYLRKKLKREIA